MNTKSKIIYLLFLLFLSACTAEENLSPEKSGRAIEIEIARILKQNEHSRASSVTVAEDQINSLWVAFFEETSGKIYGQSYEFSGSSIQGNKVRITNYENTILSRRINVVVVANPDESLMLKLKECSNISMLSNLKTRVYSGSFPTYACMYGTVKHTFTQENSKAIVSLTRLPAKVEITCDKQKANEVVRIDSYIWENIPIESYLTGTQTGTQEVERGTISTNALSDEKGLGYPYEYATGKQRGKVKIRAQKYNGKFCYYYFLLPEAIIRNHWYKFNLELVGNGGTEEAPEEVHTTFTVVPWKDEDNSVNIGDVYLECPREMSLYVRTQGIAVNPERSFIFHTNVGIGDCKIETTGDLLNCQITSIPGGGRVNFWTKNGVFQEFHPRVKTSITLTAGNISRKVDITLIPLMEIHPQRPNVIMVWPGHEFYYNSAKHGGLYVHTPFTKEGYANNQQEEPNMCQMFEVYDQDYSSSPEYGLRTGFYNYTGYNDKNQWLSYSEDFTGPWDKLNGCKRHTNERQQKSCAENIGDGWRCPTEYELRAMYQAWAHFGRPEEQGGNKNPPAGYLTSEEKALYLKARNFYKRFYYNNDMYRPYGCTTFKPNRYGYGSTVAQYFRYNSEGNTWVANPFLNDYNIDRTIIIRPVRDYAGPVTKYESGTWIDRDREARSSRR